MESVRGIIATRSSPSAGFSLQLNFQLNSLNTGFIEAINFGTISNFESSNIASFTITRNGLPVTIPFTVVRGDTISITIVRIDVAAAATIKIIANGHNQNNSSRTIFSSDTGTGRYIYCLNQRDQTVSVIDTNTDTVTATITLPSGNDFLSMCYRIVNQRIYLFGKFSTSIPITTIDADPASGNFNNVYSLSNVINERTLILPLGFGNIVSCVYDYTNDIIFFSDGANGALLNPVSNIAVSLNPISALTSFSLVFNESNGTILSAENAALYAYNYVAPNSMAKVTFRKGTSSFAATAIYNKKNGILYANGNRINLINNNLEVTGDITIASDFGDMGIGLDFDQLMIAHTFNGRNYVLNTANNTLIGNWVRGNLGVNETAARGCVYSPASKKFYVQGSGVTNANGINRVHIYNPQTWINDGSNPANLQIMDVGFITVGNLHAVASQGQQRYDQMCANSLL